MRDRGNKKRKDSRELAEESRASGELPREARGRYLVSLIVISVSVSFGNMLLKYGLMQVKIPRTESIGGIYHAGVQALSNGWLVLGIVMMIIQFIALGYALRYGPLSLTMPMRGAAAYAGTSLLAVFFLGEHVNALHWAAIFMILVGVTMIGISGETG